MEILPAPMVAAGAVPGESISSVENERRAAMGKLSRFVLGDRRDPRCVLADAFVVPVPDSGSPPREALEWARRTLDAARVDATQDPWRAMRVLRQEEDLGLRTTKYLVDHLRNGR